MAKLKTLKPMVTMMRPTVAIMAKGERERDQLRANLPWRKWYKTKRWRDLRARILVRDHYTCQATGVSLIGAPGEPNSPVVDHRKAHRGDEALFWDERNLWAVSKAYHDSTKQREERRGR